MGRKWGFWLFRMDGQRMDFLGGLELQRRLRQNSGPFSHRSHYLLQDLKWYISRRYLSNKPFAIPVSVRSPSQFQINSWTTPALWWHF